MPSSTELQQNREDFLQSLEEGLVTELSRFFELLNLHNAEMTASQEDSISMLEDMSKGIAELNTRLERWVEDQ